MGSGVTAQGIAVALCSGIAHAEAQGIACKVGAPPNERGEGTVEEGGVVLVEGLGTTKPPCGASAPGGGTMSYVSLWGGRKAPPPGYAALW